MSLGYRRFLAMHDALNILDARHQQLLDEPIEMWEALLPYRMTLAGAKIHLKEVVRDILFGAKDLTESEAFEIWRAERKLTA